MVACMPGAVHIAFQSCTVLVSVSTLKDAHFDAGLHGQYSFGHRGEPCYGTVRAVCMQQPCLPQQSIFWPNFNVLQAHSYNEIEEFQQIATGLVVNVGTLTSDWVSSMELAATTANSLGKPWVLDPVGAGATAFRTKVLFCLCHMISEHIVCIRPL